MIKILIVLLLASFQALAEPFKMPVKVIANANDSVGKRLVYFVKEDLQISSTLRLAHNLELGLGLQILTHEPYNSNPGHSVAYSYAVTWINKQQPYSYFLYLGIGGCGSSQIQECAQTIVANVAEDSDSVLRSLTAAQISQLNTFDIDDFIANLKPIERPMSVDDLIAEANRIEARSEKRNRLADDDFLAKLANAKPITKKKPVSQLDASATDDFLTAIENMQPIEPKSGTK